MFAFRLLALGISASVWATLTISDASAQHCDERFPASCPYFLEPPPRARAPLPVNPRAILPPGAFEAPSAAPYQPYRPAPRADYPDRRERYGSMYAAVRGEPFPIPAVDLSQVDPQFLRKTVYYPTHEPPGTIIINPRQHFLYFVLGAGQAIRYGVGVGRQGFGWSGSATIREKREWPDWYPPKEMIERQPELRRQLSQLQSGIGMAGGPRNPLGPRALYLWQGNKDTLYRIHGTVEPWTIGKSVSSGCIRMINQDVIDLFERAAIGTKVVVLGSGAAPVQESSLPPIR